MDIPSSLIATVSTAYGPISGIRTKSENIQSFRGIPYAKPPVGELRWRPPQKQDNWDKVLPDKILRVNNEDVIDDLEGQVKRMLDFLELPFEEFKLRQKFKS